MLSLQGHPSPEQIFEQVRRVIPSISLATVYNNLRKFLECDLLQEVSLHHRSLRIETNRSPHHHLVCIQCKTIIDLDDKQLRPLKLRPKPRGFTIKRISVDVLGVCAACSGKTTRP